MKGSIKFHHDRDNDIIIATPHWKLETEADVKAWFAQYEAYMKRFDRKMDFIAILDDFEVKPSVGPVFGEYRAKIHQQFTRHNFRVHSSKSVKLFVNTSGVRYNVATSEAATLEDAIEGIKAARREAGDP